MTDPRNRKLNIILGLSIVNYIALLVIVIQINMQERAQESVTLIACVSSQDGEGETGYTFIGGDGGLVCGYLGVDSENPIDWPGVEELPERGTNDGGS